MSVVVDVLACPNRDIGPKKLYTSQFKAHPLKKEYLITYRTMHARTVARGKSRIGYNDFVSWNKVAKQKLNELIDIYEATKPEERDSILLDYKRWLEVSTFL